MTKRKLFERKQSKSIKNKLIHAIIKKEEK